MIILCAVFGRDDPASPLRRMAGTALAEHVEAGSDDAWRDDVLIAVSELVQNVGQHTGGGGELTLSLTADGVLVEVADTAVGAPQVRHPGARQAGGRGLLLIDAMALAWGTRSGEAGKTVWALMPAPVTAVAIRAAV
ncbi:ATP-binding protein [Actinoplanes awajinensis]|uniref:Histidine kinase/HSP90-like ATPase domain-containing protein n=1 Tax=Actinoplanes awajinensis subsp. mycoplanecinus TaxID=135947 RepID=A0A0X3V9P2_9ACTN|nr:ATP-binding protein [Actinoplanes awajinensis]KUL41513.1 hypothetical protein ADL15_04505 [Actinoplanes awajinensis subsp. mycoplanecinus]